MSGKEPREQSGRTTRANPGPAGASGDVTNTAEHNYGVNPIQEVYAGMMARLDDFQAGVEESLRTVTEKVESIDGGLKSLDEEVQNLKRPAQLSETRSVARKPQISASTHRTNQNESSRVVPVPKTSTKSTKNTSKTSKLRNKSRTPRRRTPKGPHPDESTSTSSSSSGSSQDRPSHNRAGYDPSDSSPSDSSSTEGQEGDSRPPKYPGLREKKTENPAFQDVLSYRTYRLKLRDQRYNEKIAAKMTSNKKKISIHILDEQKFDGKDPISILRFLASFKVACDENRIMEGAATRLVLFFLEGEARTEYQTLLDESNIGQAVSYPQAIVHLLTTYADEHDLNEEQRKINRLKQRPGEEEKAFASRIHTQVLRLGPLFSLNDCTSVFLSGINSKVYAGYKGNPGPVYTFRNVVKQCSHIAQSLKPDPPLSLEYQPRRTVRMTTGPVPIGEHQALLTESPTSPVTPTQILSRGPSRPPTDRYASIYGKPFDCHLCGVQGHTWKFCPMLPKELAEQAKRLDLLRQPPARSGASNPRTNPPAVCATVELDQEIEKMADTTPSDEKNE